MSSKTYAENSRNKKRTASEAEGEAGKALQEAIDKTEEASLRSCLVFVESIRRVNGDLWKDGKPQTDRWNEILVAYCALIAVKEEDVTREHLACLVGQIIARIIEYMANKGDPKYAELTASLPGDAFHPSQVTGYRSPAQPEDDARTAAQAETAFRSCAEFPGPFVPHPKHIKFNTFPTHHQTFIQMIPNIPN